MIWEKRQLILLSLLLIPVSSFLEITLSQSYWPTEEWKEVSPRKANMSETILEEMIGYIEDYNNDYYSRIDSTLIFKDGKLVKEWYYHLWDEDALHVQWSVTKSFTGTLIGVAIKEGFLSSVDEHVVDFFTDRTIQNLDSRKEAMTIDHLLMMSTGLDYKGDDIEFLPWMGSDDHISHVLDKPMVANPGSYFNYDTGGSHLLSAIIQEVSGMTMEELATTYLFTPLGITDYYWDTDNQGTTFGGHGLYLTPRDMAKLGYLYINNGYWDDQQILPQNWVDYITTTEWYFDSNWGYARQWWTHPSINCYAARGKDGQAIFVLPEQNVIIIFTATISNVDPEPYLSIINEYVLEALLEPKSINYLAMILPPVSIIVIGVATIIIIRIRRN